MRRLVLSLFLSTLFSSISFACSSDCYQCHSNIPKDKEHKVISTCTNCHPNHSTKGMDKCGADCFDCHSYRKVMSSSPAHRVIKKCVKCHKAIKEENPELRRKFLDEGDSEGVLKLLTN
ncbi:hypothetical protein SAMN06269117_11265 [Balnearium lithotrophicum]|uniref:Uncharacterized protein n=1 Tax=Balnearium lithotrophicum TaxID=223788 RepID=A0A521CH92_9BACT|nr:hypothetical protein [Balnearium lithotrophicum]SMO58715.1 hypothetical protein SAMN06269117_11265 [Balnearium lithotrophicum]